MAEIVVNSVTQLPEAAKLFCSDIGENRVFLFYGGMGAGKTSFIKQICKELGVLTEVTSPTFAIVNEYEGKDFPLIYHFDFYRIEKTTEIFDIGFEEYIDSNALIFIEWPEMLKELAPNNCVEVRIIELEDYSRKICW